jgi:hypothetical protein
MGKALQLKIILSNELDISIDFDAAIVHSERGRTGQRIDFINNVRLVVGWMKSYTFSGMRSKVRLLLYVT